MDIPTAWQRAKPRLLAAAKRQLSTCLSTDSSEDDQPIGSCSEQTARDVTPQAVPQHPITSAATCCATGYTSFSHCVLPSCSRRYTARYSHTPPGCQQCPIQFTVAPPCLGHVPSPSCSPPPMRPHSHRDPSQECMWMQHNCAADIHTHTPLPVTLPIAQLPSASATMNCDAGALETCQRPAVDSKLQRVKAAMRHHSQKANSYRPQLSTGKVPRRRPHSRVKPHNCTPRQSPARHAPPFSASAAQQVPEVQSWAAPGASEAMQQSTLVQGTPLLHGMAKRMTRDTSDSSLASFDSSQYLPVSTCPNCSASVPPTNNLGPGAASLQRHRPDQYPRSLGVDAQSACSEGACGPVRTHRGARRTETMRLNRDGILRQPRDGPCGKGGGARGDAAWQRSRSPEHSALATEVEGQRSRERRGAQSSPGAATHRSSRTGDTTGHGCALVDAVDTALTALRQRTTQVRPNSIIRTPSSVGRSSVDEHAVRVTVFSLDRSMPQRQFPPAVSQEARSTIPAVTTATVAGCYSSQSVVLDQLG